VGLGLFPAFLGALLLLIGIGMILNDDIGNQFALVSNHLCPFFVYVGVYLLVSHRHSSAYHRSNVIFNEGNIGTPICTENTISSSAKGTWT